MFDWVTWSIWLVGFVILVIWIIFPLKEFVSIVKEQHAAHRERTAAQEAPPTRGEGPFDDA